MRNHQAHCLAELQLLQPPELPVITDLTVLDMALGGNGEFYNSALKKTKYYK
jgi:hypothetical protein